MPILVSNIKAGLLLLTVLLLTFGFIPTFRSIPNPDFGFKIDSFLKKYSQNFKTINENFNSNGNDFVLDNKTKSLWVKKVTLKNNTPFINSDKKIVYQRLYLSFYQYESPQQCTTAVDSLLNCFGTDCWSIKRGTDINGVHTTPNIYVINEKEIIVCHLFCEHQNESWIKFKNELITTFGNSGSDVIISGCGGPLTFRKL